MSCPGHTLLLQKQRARANERLVKFLAADTQQDLPTALVLGLPKGNCKVCHVCQKACKESEGCKPYNGITKSNDIKLGAQLAESDRIVAYCQTHCSKVSIEYFQKIGPKRRLGLLVLCQVFNQSCP